MEDEKFAYWGKEFYNSDMQKLLKKQNINHYSTYSVMKVLVVEWFNRTLKNDNNVETIYTMEITNGSTSCRISYQITTPSSELLVCVSLMLLPRSPTDSYHGLQSHKNCRTRAIQSGWFGTREQIQVFDKDYTPNWSTEV